MSENEVSRIRTKFILVSTLSFFGVMLIMGIFIYAFCTLTLKNEVGQILDYIIENEGELPEKRISMRIEKRSDDPENEAGGPMVGEDESVYVETYTIEDDDFRSNLGYLFGTGDFFSISRDYLYTTRYFAVLYDADGNVDEINTEHIAYINDEQALNYSSQALEKFSKFGSYDRYYYKVADREKGGKIVVCLERFSQMYTIRRIMYSAMFLIAVGTLLAFLLMRVLSKQVVRSEIRNIDKQKQFITNAGHELKTPLAIIRANTEMQEVLSGENEWTQSTMRQVDRMNGLIGNFVRIARAQELGGQALSEIDIAPLVTETAESFKPVAIGDGKTLETGIEAPVVLKSEEGKIRQLVALLVDNAVKYCDDGGKVMVRLYKTGRNVLLDVINSYAEGENTDYSRFFERFYREDAARTIGDTASHNPKSGYGIGLSIATELVKSLKGKMDVSWEGGNIRFTCRFTAKT
ncbi:MAG: HAMP domain-containing histidine kinase [Lachnospiraceae bacterium]|nr:HAMP domain-containing histidine kinase [Lachnospiraceae bacterium]